MKTRGRNASGGLPGAVNQQADGQARVAPSLWRRRRVREGSRGLARWEELARSLRGTGRIRPDEAGVMKHGSGLEAERIGALSPDADQVLFRVRTSTTKRIMDLMMVIPLLLVAGPIMILIALAIKIFDRGPVLYSHQRVGLDGRMFLCHKFRTMFVDGNQRFDRLMATDPAAKLEWDTFQKLRTDPRVTPLGGFLRRASLDELPQLYSILCGDMSVIGPRPITSGEIWRYGADFRYYTGVRPGVLGKWQVNGRNKLTYDQRVAMDIEYVKTWTIWEDVKILLRAIPVVLLGLGAY
jgi:lipopolysaccharide/colanic/teichoic acid biosynthesis glycosyltransferase